MLKTKTWIVIIVLLLVVCTCASMMLFSAVPESSIVEILQYGQVIKTIDLAQVSEPYSFEVEDDGGSNTILVEPGRICISEADCPDQICVHQSWLKDSAAPIVCLPHRLVIQATGTPHLDSVAK